MSHRVALLLLTIAVLTNGTMGQDTSRTGTTEQRLAAIEEKLERLERSLIRLEESLGDETLRPELETLKNEVRSLAAAVPAAESAAVPPGEGGLVVAESSTLKGSSAAAGSDEASSEIQHLPYAGYMELHLNNDGVSPATLDFHRFVLLFGHGFGDRIRFWSELELEHGFVEGGEESGELELEQAYLDFLIHPKLNFRTGMLLAPVGIINERHEPPSFYGVERPFVDTFIIPSTWFGSGVGILGDLGRGFSYKAYSMASLDATRFSAEEGFREGRQKGFLENARQMAFAGRVEYRGISGLNIGTSFWTGGTGFNLRDIGARARIFEFDLRYRRSFLEGRAQLALTRLADAGRVNRAVLQATGVNPNIATAMRGFYLEGAGHLLPTRFRHDLVTFYRYENFDTQRRMPAGFLPLKRFDRSAHVAGLSYYPYPDVVFKFDYQRLRSASEVFKSGNTWNLGIGWWF